MAHFSCGTEGLDWQARNCDRCLNADDLGACAIWDAHLMFNGDEDARRVLDTLIPFGVTGNGPCELLRVAAAVGKP